MYRNDWQNSYFNLGHRNVPNKKREIIRMLRMNTNGMAKFLSIKIKYGFLTAHFFFFYVLLACSHIPIFVCTIGSTSQHFCVDVSVGNDANTSSFYRGLVDTDIHMSFCCRYPVTFTA